ncbi:MAG: hypothetical protein QNJ67_05425 [Kiloniellales bacterium]|nr:hypothetical protein [Kiloniellales bacterium]
MRYFLAVLLLVFPLASASAQSAGNVTKELIGYNKIAVNFSANAARCNLTDASVLEKHLVEKLDEIGLKQTDESQSVVILNVAGTTLGLLGAQCSTYTGLQIQTRLRGDQVTTDNPRVRAALDRLVEIPILLWSHGAFSVTTLPQPSAGGPSLAAYDAVKSNLSVIIARLKEQRNE